MIRSLGQVSYRLARRIVIGVIGGTFALLGTVMLVAPGPGIAVLLLGLTILAFEFAWAKLWLDKVRRSVTPEGRQELRGLYSRFRERFFRRRS